MTSLAIDELCFYLKGYQQHDLHQILNTHLKSIWVTSEDGTIQQQINPDRLEFRGFGEDETVLPDAHNANPGLVLLREYFLFPDKFLFAKLKCPKPIQAGDQLRVYFVLDKPCAKFAEDSFQMNCAPVVNLFEQHIDSMTIQPNKHEYMVSADQFNTEQTEVHSLIELSQVQGNGKVFPLAKFYSEENSSTGWWLQRRESSPLPHRPGTEMFLRFFDQEFDKPLPAGSKVIGKAWCNNRSMIEKLPANKFLKMVAPSNVRGARLLKRPSRHYSPDLTGSDSRRLLAQLNANYLGLTSHRQGLLLLKNMIELQASTQGTKNHKILDGITGLTTRNIARRLPGKPWQGLIQGLEVSLHIKPEHFTHTSLPLFGQLLQQCLASFISLNSFLKLKLCDPDGKILFEGDGKEGEQWLL